jgi:phage tail-like protein
MQSAEIERLLPGVFERTLRKEGPLRALIRVMEALHEPSESILATLDATFDPRRTPEAFVPFLARWVDLERLLVEPGDGARAQPIRPTISTGLGRLRELIAAAASLSKWRGTRRGLVGFLRAATGAGADDFEIRENVDRHGQPRQFHIVIYAPAALEAHQALMRRIIDLEKPAYVTSELIFRSNP